MSLMALSSFPLRFNSDELRQQAAAAAAAEKRSLNFWINDLIERAVAAPGSGSAGATRTPPAPTWAPAPAKRAKPTLIQCGTCGAMADHNGKITHQRGCKRA